MGKINSRTKGNTFERMLAKKFTEWSGGKLTFRRTPLSGGWDPRAQTGDIFPLEMKDTFPFIIEARKNEQFTLDNLLDDSSIVIKWITEKENLYSGHRKKYGHDRKPLIFIMCKNNRTPVVVLNRRDFYWFDEDIAGKYGTSLEDVKHIHLWSDPEDHFILNLDDFLDAIKYEYFSYNPELDETCEIKPKE